MKAGRVVILLAGRHAGKKAIIVKQYDDGKKVSAALVDCCIN
jgi:ribosomal protein L14E/L6E/L27E